jgi:threonine/homoserine/homoserine lactone efflux protein
MTDDASFAAVPHTVHPDERQRLRETPRTITLGAVQGDLLTLTVTALGIALSPLPLLLVVGLLGASGPGTTAVAFVSGEAIAIGVVLLGAIFVFGSAGSEGGSLGLAQPVLELTIGALLLALLLVHLRRPRRSQEGTALAMLERVGAPTAFAGGLGMVLVNPKNLALTLAGAATIVDLTSSTGARVAALTLFTAGAVSLVAALVAAMAVFPERGGALLGRGRDLVMMRERAVVASLLVVLGTFFLVRGLRALAG